MSVLTLEQANAIIACALSKGRELGLKPLTIAALDAGGHLVALQRDDGSANLRPKVAIGKANGALALGVSSRQLGVMAVERPHFVGALGAMAPDGLTPAAGGLAVIDGAGVLIGAVGVSGDTPDNDELCALAGIAAAGLRAQA